LPSKQEKVSVPDKRLVVCSEDELTVIEPAGLQAELGVAMGRVRRGRCFVRPSGTEDVVRIYAEASTAEEVQLLTDCTRDIIRRYLG
jgi:phosphoacetylglucosamine mutase